MSKLLIGVVHLKPLPGSPRFAGNLESILVSAVATGQYGQEGKILRFVFWHSLALALLMGLLVMLQAYVFTWMIPLGPSG